MTLAEKRAKKAEQKAADERLVKVMEAAKDERIRFNIAVNALHKRAVLNTAFGKYVVNSVDADFWYHTNPLRADGMVETCYGSERAFCGCNDGRWDDLMKQVGEPRNPLFA